MSGVLFSFIHYNVCIFAILKHTLKNIPPINVTSKIPDFFISALCVPLTIITLIIIIITYITLGTLKLVVVLILKVKHQENYGGVLKSADMLWTEQNETAYNIINLLFLIKHDKSKKDVTSHMREVCKYRFFKAKRLTSIIKYFMGYGYFLCNQLTIDDVVKTKKFTNYKFCKRKDLQLFVQRHSNLPLPRNNTAAFEMIVGEEPVDLDDGNTDGKLYPVVIRIHHCVCDGMTLLSMIIQHVSDEGLTIVNDSEAKLAKYTTKVTKKDNLMKKIRDNVKITFNARANLLTHVLSPDRNILKTSNLSGEKKIGFYVEKNKLLMKKIKFIKDSVNGTFTDVILTGMSASLNKFFQRKFQKVPDNINLTFMAIADRKDVRFDHEELKNIFSLGSIRLPINIKLERNEIDLIRRLQRTVEEYQKFKDSADIWIYYWMFNTLLNLLPKYLLGKLIKLNDVTTTSFSNVPGFKKIHIAGDELDHILFWVPNYLTTGIGFSLISYDDKFQMGLLVDKKIIPNEDDVQEVLDDVIKSIEMLYEKIRKTKIVN